MNKTAIKNFAIWARNKLIADVSYDARLIGITEDGIAKPLPQSFGGTQFFDIGTTVLTFDHLLYPPPILCHYDSFIIRYNKWEHNKNPQPRMSGSADFSKITLLFFLFLL